MPFDLPEESLFVLIFLLISFFNWVGEQVKKAKRGPLQPPTPTSTRHYEQQAPPLPQQRHAQPQPQRPQQPMDPMRQILESLGIPMEEERVPVEQTPPPLPSPVVIKRPPPPKPTLTLEEEEALKRVRAMPAKVHHRPQTRASIEARKLLRPEHAQTAFVLKEILDKPKCFDL